MDGALFVPGLAGAHCFRGQVLMSNGKCCCKKTDTGQFCLADGGKNGRKCPDSCGDLDAQKTVTGNGYVTTNNRQCGGKPVKSCDVRRERHCVQAGACASFLI